MRRRDFIALMGGIASWPLTARAQHHPPKLRIGVTTIQSWASPIYTAFNQRLRELGYIEGENLPVDLLNPQDETGGIAAVVAELVHRKVDVIVASYESTVKAALAARTTIPIVMIAIDYDPLALGYVKSLSRPGNNITGLFLQQPELARKRLQLLAEALPDLQSGTMFWDPSSEYQWNATSSAARDLGLQLVGIQMRDQPYDYEKALARAPADNRKVVMVATSGVFYRERQRVADFALQNKIASVFALREWVDAGGLFSYGANFPAVFRRAAEFVDMIARGTKAADLPVEQPTNFELVLNLKTAKAIGVTISALTLVRADEVIE
jgi:putative tryptophan/tyrosine transport system substrate-binding protein